MGLLTQHRPESVKQKIREGVKRTIKLRRARRTKAQILADPLDKKRVDFTKEAGLTNGRQRVRDLRNKPAPDQKPYERGIYFFDAGRYLKGDALTQHTAETNRLRFLAHRPSRPPHQPARPSP